VTDAHCHISSRDSSVRELLIGRDFVGVHPWDASSCCESSEVVAACLADALSQNLRIGVGEIGLDRLHERNISERMRQIFEAQLKVALTFTRPIVLHGAKCWGQVVETVKWFTKGSSSKVPFLFHGFSRSDGLIPDVVQLNGYFSVGPAILNDHAVNYRHLVQKIPSDRLLLETDRTTENADSCPPVRDILLKTAEIRGVSCVELEAQTDANADLFWYNRQK